MTYTTAREDCLVGKRLALGHACDRGQGENNRKLQMHFGNIKAKCESEVLVSGRESIRMREAGDESK